jgi:hypothetical protein
MQGGFELSAVEQVHLDYRTATEFLEVYKVGGSRGKKDTVDDVLVLVMPRGLQGGGVRIATRGVCMGGGRMRRVMMMMMMTD